MKKLLNPLEDTLSHTRIYNMLKLFQHKTRLLCIDTFFHRKNWVRSSAPTTKRMQNDFFLSSISQLSFFLSHRNSERRRRTKNVRMVPLPSSSVFFFRIHLIHLIQLCGQKCGRFYILSCTSVVRLYILLLTLCDSVAWKYLFFLPPSACWLWLCNWKQCEQQCRPLYRRSTQVTKEHVIEFESIIRQLSMRLSSFDWITVIRHVLG